jgi:putative ABC transport system permease protein
MLWNAFNLAQREIRRNVLRSSLTTLGIIIGVSAVIIMATLGNGATAAVTADIANLASNLLTVMPGQRMGPGGASGSAKPFKRRDVDLLTRDVTSVGAVAPVSSQGHERDCWQQESVVDRHRHDERVLQLGRLAVRERSLLQRE